MSELADFFRTTDTHMGLVFYPTHFIFAAFPSLELARNARDRVIECGWAENQVHVASDTEVWSSSKSFAARKACGPNL